MCPPSVFYRPCGQSFLLVRDRKVGLTKHMWVLKQSRGQNGKKRVHKVLDLSSWVSCKSFKTKGKIKACCCCIWHFAANWPKRLRTVNWLTSRQTKLEGERLVNSKSGQLQFVCVWLAIKIVGHRGTMCVMSAWGLQNVQRVTKVDQMWVAHKQKAVTKVC